MMKHWIIALFGFLLTLSSFAQSTLHITITDSTNNKALSGSLYLNGKSNAFIQSHAVIEQIQNGNYSLMVLVDDYQTYQEKLTVNGDSSITVILTSMEHCLGAINVRESLKSKYRLSNVEGTQIFATKKTELILPDLKVANLSNNNSRQVYQSIAGLNIWENDASGIQLNIGSRGLDPNRTSNFNTRQNGYDISADALGYPESYYTPPLQAVERVEFVRGAASLQYGPQFGGLLNFKLKEKEPGKMGVRQSLTYGSYQYFQSFTSVGGSNKGFDYYGFYQRKNGNSFRPNSNFAQNTAYISTRKHFNKKTNLGFQYTHMNYLAHQPGGLTDLEFRQDPYQSKRTRNWFDVHWNLFAFDFNHKWGSTLQLNGKVFALDASRSSAGDLSRPNRPESAGNRSLIVGEFKNIGTEWKLLKKYQIKGIYSNFLFGVRGYRGFNHSRQGFTSDEVSADFQFINPNHVGVSDFEFPGYNLALFTENVFYLNKKWIINPGMRYEVIQTSVDGFYKNRLVSGGRIIFEDTIKQQKKSLRHFPLLGIGSTYKINQNLECLANFTQNYRSINFSDITITNPNLKVDANLKDERGYNVDLGVRGNLLNKALWINTSLFYLNYKNRIGLSEIEEHGQMISYRTNIGNAHSYGVELFSEFDWTKTIIKRWSKLKLTTFINASYTQGIYSKGKSFYQGNQLEYLVPWMLKTGLSAAYQGFSFSYQYSAQDQQFTDATNATLVADATRGVIPSFAVHDFNLGYETGRWNFQLNASNILNKAYYTRRALSYPGPGIITAEPRAFYLNLVYTLIKKP